MMRSLTIMILAATAPTLAGCFRRPPGPPGLQGAQGEKGERGDKGDKGDKGDLGKGRFNRFIYKEKMIRKIQRLNRMMHVAADPEQNGGATAWVRRTD